MKNSGLKPTREAFLTGAAMLAAAGTAAGAAVNVSGIPAIQAILHRPAQHKQVLAAVKVDHGTPLRHAMNGLNAFEYAFREGAGALHVACVLYGSSLVMVANDSLWAKYKLFDVLDRAGDGLPDMLHTPQNPFYRAKPGAGRDDASVETLTRRGVSWMVCNNALHGFAGFIAAMQHLESEKVYEDFRNNFVAGVTLVPAGVAAIVLAQEAGFTFLFG